MLVGLVSADMMLQHVCEPFVAATFGLIQAVHLQTVGFLATQLQDIGGMT